VSIYVAQLERLITAHPEQWVSTLAPIWDTDDTSETAAENRNPAATGNQLASQSAIQSA
jgi:hypothetical protein